MEDKNNKAEQSGVGVGVGVECKKRKKYRDSYCFYN